MTDVTIEDILAQLDKDTLKMVRTGRQIEKRTIPTASFGLNMCLAGGFYLGKQHTVYGNEQAGKSALMMQTVAINQALGVPCAWIDAEHSFDQEWAQRLGIDVDKLIVSQASTIGGVGDLQVKFIEAGMGLIVIDSQSSLLPKSYMDENGHLKEADGRRQIGQHAKDLGEMCSTVQSINFDCAVVHISQMRNDLSNSFAPGMKPTGGKQVAHTDQVRIRLTSSKADAKAIKQKIQRGNALVETKVGRTVNWIVDKNKVNGRIDTGQYDLIVLGDNVGISRDSELVAYGIEYGVIDRAGSWYTLYDERFQGDKKLIEYLRENREVAEKLEAEIVAQSL